MTSSTVSLFAYQVNAFIVLEVPCGNLQLDYYPNVFFFCVIGVADQLQTNYASDLRSILKTLFEVMATQCEQGDNDKLKKSEENITRMQQFMLLCKYYIVSMPDSQWI